MIQKNRQIGFNRKQRQKIIMRQKVVMWQKVTLWHKLQDNKDTMRQKITMGQKFPMWQKDTTGWKVRMGHKVTIEKNKWHSTKHSYSNNYRVELTSI